MRYFKDIITYVNVGLSIQTHHILRHFLNTLSMIHMPPKPIESAGSKTSIILM